MRSYAAEVTTRTLQAFAAMHGLTRRLVGLCGLCGLALALTLSACGGGGGGSPAAAAAPSGGGSSGGGSAGSGGNNAGGGGTSGGGGGSGNSTASNSVTISVDAGIESIMNLPQVSLTLCAPGTTTCQTIDHILIDTGSTGVRIASAALNAQLLAALPQETIKGASLNACEQFLDGYTWGTMRLADVTLGPQTAGSQPVQIFGDSAAGSAPSSCTDRGTLAPQNTPEDFGTNGIIGLSAFLQDCGTTCAQQAVAAAYYTCGAGTCQSAITPLAMQAQNLVANFAQDNNGVVVSLPAVSASGQTTASGTLYFGVATQANNAMAGAAVLKTDPSTLNVTVMYNGTSIPDSFLDSGSNLYYLSDRTIPACALNGSYAGFYCPSSTQNLTAGFITASGATYNQNFSIANAQTLLTANPTAMAFNNLAATGSGGMFDFGLPFFYGRQIGVLNEGQSAFGQSGPFTAIVGM